MSVEKYTTAFPSVLSLPLVELAKPEPAPGAEFCLYQRLAMCLLT